MLVNNTLLPFNNTLLPLPDNIIFEMLPYLKLTDLQNLRACCIQINLENSGVLSNIYLEVFKNLGYRLIPSPLVKMIDDQIEIDKKCLGRYFDNLRYYLYFNRTFLPLHLVSKIPFVNYRKSFMGSTGYLDRIRKRHLNHPIMVGRDCYRRAFLSIKYRCRQSYFNQVDRQVEVNTKKTRVLTVFQRYTDNLHSWCKAGSVWDDDPILNSSNTLLHKRDKQLLIINLLQFIAKEKPYYHRFYDRVEREGERIDRETVDCYLVE